MNNLYYFLYENQQVHCVSLCALMPHGWTCFKTWKVNLLTIVCLRAFKLAFRGNLEDSSVAIALEVEEVIW